MAAWTQNTTRCAACGQTQQAASHRPAGTSDSAALRAMSRFDRLVSRSLARGVVERKKRHARHRLGNPAKLNRDLRSLDDLNQKRQTTPRRDKQ